MADPVHGHGQNGSIPPNGYGSAVILSLDGGGIRGYSSLLILKRLMELCTRFEREENRTLQNQYGPALQQPNPTQDPLEYGLPLPCHYFDYIVGTSTGGLTAIMLGRLRMSVRACLHVYKDLGNTIFSQKRYYKWTRYSSERLAEVLKQIIRLHCRDANSAQDGLDFMHQSDTVHNPCRTIVYAARVLEDENETIHAFRSYHPTGSNEESHEVFDNRNPRQVCIFEAGLATSAAPTFFKVAKVNGEKFLDGGITANNPTIEAFNEAYRMRLRRNLPPHVDASGPAIGHVVSLGTGLKEGQSILTGGTAFGKLRRVIKRAIRHMTDTEPTHRIMVDRARQYLPTPVPYHRLNVSRGLENIKLDHCKSKDRTFTKIDQATQVYLDLAETMNRMTHCARLLVERRRGRCAAEELRRNFNLTQSGPRENVYNDLYPAAPPAAPPPAPLPPLQQ